MSNIQELKPFNVACEEFVSGKYILVDIKISSILKLIAEDEKLSNIVNSCLTNYDFLAKKKDHFISNGESNSLLMPTDEKDIIAFVYKIE